jgi:hypothetical protein
MCNDAMLRSDGDGSDDKAQVGHGHTLHPQGLTNGVGTATAQRSQGRREGPRIGAVADRTRQSTRQQAQEQQRRQEEPCPPASQQPRAAWRGASRSRDLFRDHPQHSTSAKQPQHSTSAKQPQPYARHG